MIYPAGELTYTLPVGAFQSMIFFFPFGGICCCSSMESSINILKNGNSLNLEVGHEKKTSYFPLNPGWLIGILLVAILIIPIQLGSERHHQKKH